MQSRKNREKLAKDIVNLKEYSESIIGLDKESMEYILHNQTESKTDSSSIEIMTIPKEHRRDLSENELRKKIIELIEETPSDMKPLRTQYIIKQDYHYTAIDIYIGDNEAKCFVLDAAGEPKKQNILDALLKDTSGTPLENLIVYDADGGSDLGNIQYDVSSCPLFAMDHALVLARSNPYEILDKSIADHKSTSTEASSTDEKQQYSNHHRIPWQILPFEYVENAQNKNFINLYKKEHADQLTVIEAKLSRTTETIIGKKGLPKDMYRAIELKHGAFAKKAIDSLIMEEKYVFLCLLKEKCNPNSEIVLFKKAARPSKEMQSLMPLLNKVSGLAYNDPEVNNIFHQVEAKIMASSDYELVDKTGFRDVKPKISAMENSYSSFLRRLPAKISEQLSELPVDQKLTSVLKK